ncbi:Aminopeptidase N-11 [Operophtera brumata]|uniref:Aminopeptidase N-11 n=1 Tax=Operophtera brumata TaxID=104452 RepID=A0A0L7LH69_OPEBR|nr:Aminopeptidase N-11 [Operophtera brumata]
MSATKCICVLFLIIGLTSSLPIIVQNEPNSLLPDESYPIRLEDESNELTDAIIAEDSVNTVNEILEVDMEHEVNYLTINNTEVVQVVNEVPATTSSTNYVINTVKSNLTMRNQIRPGMHVTSYSIEITPNVNDDTFSGRLTVQVNIIDLTTREDPVMFYVRDLDIDSVVYSLVGGTNFAPVADFDVDEDDGILEIETGVEATLYTFVIEYRGTLLVPGQGLYTGRYDST